VDAARAAEAVLEAYEGGVAVAVVAVVSGPAPGRRLLAWEEGSVEGTLGDGALDRAALALAHRALEAGGAFTEAVDVGGRITLYAEAHRPPDELLVVGAGHIAVPLAELGVRLGYRVTVLDDREAFATAERFPAAATVLRTDFSDPFRAVRLSERSHVILVTRAHRYDFDCLRQLLEGSALPRYIGMIGSRRRVKAAFLALLEAGVPRARLGVVRAPLGLNIGAETPEEIAVSIAAELIMLRRGLLGAQAAALPLSDKERVLDRLLPTEERDG
jgi:xanthine dehydrogenase accessory factor